MNDTTTVSNYPLEECVRKAQTYINKGAKVYQKFTCANCGQRLTMDVPNTFYETGDCDKCGHVTDIKADGCNYMMVLR